MVATMANNNNSSLSASAEPQDESQQQQQQQQQRPEGESDSDTNSTSQADETALLEQLALALKAEQERVLALPSMQLTPQERAWAHEIKRATEADPELHNLSDMEYVQYAIVTEGDVEDSLRRMHGLQVFRQEYGINDTLEQGIALMQALLEQQPGLVISVDKAKTSTTSNAAAEEEQEDSHYMMVLDFAKINPKAMRLPQDKRNVLGGLYYCHHATQTTPTAIRNGILFIAECEGMTFDNISLDFIGPIYREMKSHYPVRIKEVSWLRAATAATVMYSLSKCFVPKRIQARVNLGCEFNVFDGRLDALFLTQDTPQENLRLVLTKASNHLAERLRNVQLFRL